MYGRQVLGTLGFANALSADGNPRAKIGGCTIDWVTVAAVSGSDVTLADGTVVKIGEKYLPVGQVIVRITSVVSGSTIGKYGPWDIAATDGRQTLVAGGDNYVLNRPTFQADPKGDYPEAIYGGRIYQARALQSGVGTHSLAAGPTLAEFKAAFPLFEYVTGN